MQAAGDDNRYNDQRGKGKNGGPLPEAREGSAQVCGQHDHQSDLEHGEHIAEGARVPVADRAAEDPAGNRPELAAGVVVMGQEVRKGVKQAGSDEVAQDSAAAPKGESEKSPQTRKP